MVKLIINVILFFFVSFMYSQVKEITVSEDFDKIIVSPHIETIFKQGKENSIVVETISEPIGKFKIEHTGKTLQVYLEGAKTVTKNKKVVYNGYKRKKPIYKGKVASVVITYKSVNIFSLRGEEKHIFESPIEQEKCTFRIYGASEVIVKEIDIKNLKLTTYGETIFTANKGLVAKQKITAYGESKIVMDGVESHETKLTAYGDGTFKFNISDKFKVNSYGEATISYKGNARLKKGLVIGKSIIRNIE